MTAGIICKQGEWNPQALPFRLTVVVPSSASYHHGWTYRAPRMFATLNEAVEEAKKPQGGKVLSVSVDEAINPATWQKNGRWQRRFYRKGGKASVAR